MAEVVGVVLFLKSAPTLAALVGSTGDDGTGETPWGTFLRHHPTTPSEVEPAHPDLGEIAREDLDQAREEDFVEDDSDDDDENASPDEHARARTDANRILASKIGTVVSRRCASAGKTATWTVVESTSLHFLLVVPRPSPPLGLVGGLPLLPSREPDLLSLCLALYPGDMSSHITVMKACGLRGNVRWIPIIEHEYIRFWGLIHGARQFSE